MTKIDMPQIYLMNYYKLKSRNQSENEKRKKKSTQYRHVAIKKENTKYIRIFSKK